MPELNSNNTVHFNSYMYKTTIQKIAGKKIIEIVSLFQIKQKMQYKSIDRLIWIKKTQNRLVNSVLTGRAPIPSVWRKGWWGSMWCHSLLVFFSSSPVSGLSPVWDVFWLFSWLTIWSCGTIGCWELLVELTWLFWQGWLVGPSCFCWLVPGSGLPELPCWGDWWAW